MNSDEKLSVNDMAREANVCYHTARSWILKGWIPAHRVGAKLIRVKRSDFEKFLNERSVGAI